MPYWGNKSDQCDFAATSNCAIMLSAKQLLLRGIDTALSQKFKEQAMVANLICLRVMGERFPKALSVVFGRKDFEFVKTSFEQWCELARPQLSRARLAGIIADAEQEFALFEERIFPNRD